MLGFLAVCARVGKEEVGVFLGCLPFLFLQVYRAWHYRGGSGGGAWRHGETIATSTGQLHVGLLNLLDQQEINLFSVLR